MAEFCAELHKMKVWAGNSVLASDMCADLINKIKCNDKLPEDSYFLIMGFLHVFEVQPITSRLLLEQLRYLASRAEVPFNPCVLAKAGMVGTPEGQVGYSPTEVQYFSQDDVSGLLEKFDDLSQTEQFEKIQEIEISKKKSRQEIRKEERLLEKKNKK